MDASITGSTIENNKAVYYGGGIDAPGFNLLVISGSTITGNQTTAHQANAIYQGGGGVFIDGEGASPALPAKISNTKIAGNRSAYDGCGVNAVKGVALTISGSTISGNAGSALGGGLCAFGSGANAVSLAVTTSTVSGNTANSGGGIYAGDQDSAGAGGTLSISRSTITGNTAFRGGGGLYIDGSSSATIKDIAVTGNSAHYYGGGMNIAFLGSFTVSGGSFTGNSAGNNIGPSAPLDDGGGIFLNNASGSIKGVAISGNVAFEAGGGVSDRRRRGDHPDRQGHGQHRAERCQRVRDIHLYIRLSAARFDLIQAKKYARMALL
jgi:predicted outer membrane repeat protein